MSSIFKLERQCKSLEAGNAIKGNSLHTHTHLHLIVEQSDAQKCR